MAVTLDEKLDRGLSFVPLTSGLLCVLAVFIMRNDSYLKKRSPYLLMLFLLGTSMIDFCSTSIRYHPFGSKVLCEIASFFFDISNFLIVVPFLMRCARFYFVFFGSQIMMRSGIKRLAENGGEEDGESTESFRSRLFETLSRAKEDLWLKMFGCLAAVFIVFEVTLTAVPHPEERCDQADETHSPASLIIFAITMCVFIGVVTIFLYLLRDVHDAFSISWELRIVGVLFSLYLLLSFLEFYLEQDLLLIASFGITCAVQIASGWIVIVTAQHRKRRRKRLSKARSTASTKRLSGPSVRDSTASLGLPLMMDTAVSMEKSNDPFSQVIARKYGRDAFREFLLQEFSAENLLFWEECSAFSEEPSTALAHAIVERYIRPNAPVEVNLPGEDRQLVIAAIDSWDDRRELSEQDANVFAPLQRHVWQVMRFDSFPRFRDSPLYVGFRKQWQREYESMERAKEAGMI
jgi:hypothetical protein